MNERSHVTNEIYHVYNRGVDKRDVYSSSGDYSYFIHLLYEFNNAKKANNTKRNLDALNKDGRGSTSTIKNNGRECFVDILAFCLMPNHYHLLVKQRQDDGVAKFMQKIGTGYTMYFNEKYSRSGSLFQGRYKSVHVCGDSQLLYIPHYIHLNPLSLTNNEDHTSGNTFLEQYKWSSYKDYLGEKNFPSLIKKSLILDMFGGSEKYIADIKKFISNKLTENIEDSLLIDKEDSLYL